MRWTAAAVLTAIFFCPPTVAAYDASIGWQPVAGAHGYRIHVRYGAGATAQPMEVGVPTPDPDGLLRVVLTSLPLGPTTYFSATAYDANGANGALSAALSIPYAEAAAVSDTDDDGLTDADEDVDLDGTRDTGETNPRDRDSDDDGLADGSETHVHGSDPLSADSDGDGWTDADEIGSGSDPLDSASEPTGCAGGCSTPVDCAGGCDDGNPCTLDVCELGRCFTLPATATCDDGLVCSTFDRCDAGVCRGLDTCGNGERCDRLSGTCSVDEDVWLVAARAPSATRHGTMTASGTYARGSDQDSSADSLAQELVYSSSAASTLKAGSGDEVRYTVELANEGDWYLWGRVYYPGAPGTNDANSFFARMDTGAARTLGNRKDNMRRWHFAGDGANEDGALVPLALGRLAAGRHTLAIEKREVVPAAPRLDVLFLTRDPTRRPTDADARAALGDALADVSTTTTTLRPTTTTTTTTLPPSPPTTLPPPECSSAADCGRAPLCTTIACAAGKCVRSAAASGSCDDRDPCTVGDACASGACTGWPLDCSHLDSACGYGVCDPSTSVCAAFPIASGTRCDDGSACTVGDTCNDGACVAGESCDAVSFCDQAAGRCKVRHELWIAAGSDRTALFSGAMRSDTLYADGADSDRNADSIEPKLVYAASKVAALKGGSSDFVTYTVKLPVTGVWYLWARLYYPGAPGSNDANSFFARVDTGARFRLGNNKDYYRRWHWGGDGADEHGTPTGLRLGRLAAGAHRLTIEKREVVPAAPRIDLLVLTQDPTWVPTDPEQ